VLPFERSFDDALADEGAEKHVAGMRAVAGAIGRERYLGDRRAEIRVAQKFGQF
jgi:hypothetical protein